MFDLSTKSGRLEYMKQVAHMLYLEGNDTFVSSDSIYRGLAEQFIDGEIDLDTFTQKSLKIALSHKANGKTAS